MGESNATIEIKASAAQCYGFTRESVTHPKYVTVYKSLHSGKEYSGQIVDDIENRRIVIEESGIDSVTKIRHKGWTIKYDFKAAGANSTHVTISVEYGTFLAIAGMTTTKLQSINEILARTTALLALEYA